MLTIAACPKEFHEWTKRHFWDRFVFPLRGPDGSVVGLQTRSLIKPEEGPTYQDYYRYPSELIPYLFGLDQSYAYIWEAEHVVLVEGIFDYFAISKLHDGVVACLTANLNAAGLRFIKRHCKTVTALLDMDEPGRKAVDKLRYKLQPIHVSAPGYSLKDPGEMFDNHRLSELGRILPVRCSKAGIE